MPYDPNDPNQGSQAPPEDQATPEWQTKNATTGGSIDALVKQRPGVAQFLAAHNGGRNLSAAEQQQLFQVIQQSGFDTQMLEIDKNGTFSVLPGHTVRDIALGSLLAFGPVVAAWALPAVAGSASVAGPATGSTVGAGLSVPAALVPVAAGAPGAAATTALATAVPAAAGAGVGAALAPAAASSTAPAASSIPAATYGPTGAVTNLANVPADTGSLLSASYAPSLIGTAGNVIGSLIQANAAGNASDASRAYLEEALAYEKQKDAANIAREGGRYADYTGNIAPYLATGASAGNRMASALGLSAPSNTAPSTRLASPNPGIAPTLPIQPTAEPVVTMRAPDGSTKQIPQSQVAHFTAQGATVLQGAA